MKVAVLARGLDRPGGVSRLMRGLLGALPAAAPDWLFYAITDVPLPVSLTAPNLKEVRLSPSHAAVFDHVRAPRAARGLGADVFLATKNTLPLGLSCPSVCIFLDLGYFAFPNAYRVADNIYMRAMFRRSARRADRIICISRATHEDVAAYLGPAAYGKAEVVYPGVSDKFRVLEEAELAAARATTPGLPERFLLYAGNISPRKNLERLLGALSRLDRSVGLVMTGHRRWKSPGFDEAAAAAARGREVRLLGAVDDETLCGLYNMAHASVYPSLFEGFGFPVLESMACGTPVAASNASSVGEAAGEAAVLFDPHDTAEMARALETVVHDEALRESLRRKGLARARRFTWRRAAEEVLKVLEEAA